MPIEIAVAFFLLMNLVASVLYLLMAFLPRAAITRRVMGSLGSIAIPALIHTTYLILWMALQPPSLNQLPKLYAEPQMFGQAGVEFLARALGTPTAVVAV